MTWWEFRRNPAFELTPSGLAKPGEIGQSRIAQSAPDVARLDGVVDIVDAQELVPGLHSLEGERQAAAEALMCRGFVAERADHALAARPEQQRLAERVEQRQRVQQREVLGHRLAEADAGIENDAIARDSSLDRPIAHGAEPVEHV